MLPIVVQARVRRAVGGVRRPAPGRRPLGQPAGQVGVERPAVEGLIDAVMIARPANTLWTACVTLRGPQRWRRQSHGEVVLDCAVADLLDRRGHPADGVDRRALRQPGHRVRSPPASDAGTRRTGPPQGAFRL
jgi:hypothetical protein